MLKSRRKRKFKRIKKRNVGGKNSVKKRKNKIMNTAKRLKTRADDNFGREGDWEKNGAVEGGKSSLKVKLQDNESCIQAQRLQKVSPQMMNGNL